MRQWRWVHSRVKRQLFIDSSKEADSLTTAHNRTLNEWQLLTNAPDLTNDRFVVGSGRYQGNRIERQLSAFLR